MQHIFIRNRSSGKGCEAPAKDAAAEERPDTTLRLEESEEVPTGILGSVLGLEVIMHKGQDEVLAKEAVEFYVLIREQLGDVLTAAPSVNIRCSQSRPALKVLPDLFNAEVLLDDILSRFIRPECLCLLA